MSTSSLSPQGTNPDAANSGGQETTARKKRKIPWLVWAILVWGGITWLLWGLMMRPEIPPLKEGLLALAGTVPPAIGTAFGTDIPTDSWTRDYQARLLAGEKKHTDPAHRDAHRVLCIREAIQAKRLDVACATARSIEGPAKRDEVMVDLIPLVATDCQGLPLAVWTSMTLHSKEAKIPIHKLLNERWDECPR